MPEQIRCLVVEDEPLAQQVLAGYIQTHPGLMLAGTCFTAAEAFAFLHQQAVDLLFLDIKMPAVRGTDFIRSLKEPPAFIFTTAYSEYALEGFELEAVDYLLKPVSYERFSKSVSKFLRQRTETSTAVKNYLYLKTDGELVKVFFADIHYAEAMKDYIKIITSRGILLVHMTMKSLLSLLPASNFLRIHRSYIINKNAVSRVGKSVVEICGEEIPVGENYRDNLSRIAD